jgi:hypothetical protein
MVGRAQNKLTTAEFVTCHGNQYELLNDQFDSPTEGTVLSFEYELRTVVPSPADGIGQYVDFDFKINIATEDPREWHYYVYFYFVDMRHPETQGISPPLATKKRLQRPIEQSKWKSSIQIVNPGLGYEMNLIVATLASSDNAVPLTVGAPPRPNPLKPALWASLQ